MAVEIIDTLNNRETHAAAVATLCNSGWDIVGYWVVRVGNKRYPDDVLYTTMLCKDETGRRPDLSSLRESVEGLEQQLKQLKRRVRVLEDTEADRDDFVPANYSFEAQTYIQIIDEAIAEDLRNGVAGADGPDDTGLEGKEMSEEELAEINRQVQQWIEENLRE